MYNFLGILPEPQYVFHKKIYYLLQDSARDSGACVCPISSLSPADERRVLNSGINRVCSSHGVYMCYAGDQLCGIS